MYKQLAAVNAAKDVLQRELFAEKIANFATVANMAKELAAEKAANKVLADAVSAAEGKADSAAEQVAAMQKELVAEKAANKVFAEHAAELLGHGRALTMAQMEMLGFQWPN